MNICLEAKKEHPNDPKILRSIGRIFLKEENFKQAFNYFSVKER